MSFTVIQPRRNTAAGATASNPVLASGERGFETDTGLWKTGNGTTPWNLLPYDVAKADVESTQSRRVQLTDSCIGRGQNGGGVVTATGTYRFRHKVGVAGTSIQVGFGNWYCSGSPMTDVDPTTSVTFSASLEDAAGNNFQLQFAGDKTKLLPGGGFVLSDPLSIGLLVGDVVFVRTYLSAGTAYANRLTTGAWSGQGGGGYTVTTDLTATGAGTVTAGYARGLDAMCIVGIPTGTGRPKSVILQGDSITAGAADGGNGTVDPGYDPGTLAYGAGGLYMRALTGSAGVISVAQSTDQMTAFVANKGHFRRGTLTRFAKFAIIPYGVNDIYNSRTAAQLQADILAQAKSNVSQGLVGSIVATLTPNCTSTDSFATVANQTLVSGTIDAIRVAHNTWVRGGCPIVNGVAVAVGTAGALLAGQYGHPILGYVDVANAVESSLNSGKWKAAIRVITDGAITSGQGLLSSPGTPFTSADIGRDVAVPGAGAAGATLTATIYNVVTGVAQLTNNASTTVSGATCPIGIYTLDGLHPGTTGNAMAAAAIQAPLLALLV